jgi:hypothetical protein
MANVVIPPHHQSAPKEHWAEREIMAAAREIDEGKWEPDPDPERDQAMASLGLALGLGTSGVAVGEKPAFEEFRHTHNLHIIGQHPRVVEALERMREEVYAPPDPHAALERNYAMHELAEQAAKPQKWDGQGRWEGHDNEQMRWGTILTPNEFYDKLVEVVGPERIRLGEYLVRTSQEAKSGRIGLYVPNPEWKGEKAVIDDRLARIQQLRDTGLYELKRAKGLRMLGLNAEADKRVELAAQMAEEAMRLQMDMSAAEQLQPPEFLRVGTLQWPAGTEWMIMAFTEYGAVYQARFLGWRTALLTMIRSRAITEREAHQAFPVGSGPAGNWYLNQLKMLRSTV